MCRFLMGRGFSMFKRTVLLAVVLALSACAMPPKPPSCDGNNKRPINKEQKNAQQKIGSVVSAASFQCV